MKRYNMITLGIVSTLALAACGLETGELFTGGGNPGGGGNVPDGGTQSSSSSMGGSNGGGNTGGAGGSGGTSTATSSTSSTSSGPCVPKTCLTLAVELSNGASGTPDACGILSDGCGNFIDCGGCDNPNQACGANAPNNHGGGPTDQGTPHLCGGGCTAQNMQTSDSACGATKQFWICTNKTVNQPTSVTTVCSSYGNPGQPSSEWCCAK